MNMQSEKLESLPLCLHLKKHFLSVQTVSLVAQFLSDSLGEDTSGFDHYFDCVSTGT